METTNNWLTVEDVARLYPLLSERAQVQARYKKQLSYTKCAGKCIYKREWIEEYLMRNMVKAAS